MNNHFIETAGDKLSFSWLTFIKWTLDLHTFSDHPYIVVYHQSL